MDSRIRQTSTASPAEPGELSCWYSDQVNPSVAMIDPYHYVVVWSGNASNDADAVTASIFLPPNTAPVITSDGGGSAASLSIAENTTAVTTVTAADADFPAQTLTYSIAGGADKTKFSIDAATGVLTFMTPPNYEARADANGDNAYQVTVEVSDGALTDTQDISVTITDVNEAPVAANDLYAVDQNATLTVPAASGLLANDSDPESDALSISTHTLPSNGTLSLDTVTGAFVYTPDTNYVGSDGFTYTTTDGHGHTSVANATININAANAAPAIAGSVTLTSVAEDTPRLITQTELLSNASDANGDSLSATGLAISSGSGVLVNNGDGTWTYIPALDDDTAVSFSYSVFDGILSTADSASLDITPVNDAPSAANDSINVSEDVPHIGTLPVASDAESDPITYGLGTQATHGAVVVDTDGSYTYTPNSNYYGTDSFAYIVSDNSSGANVYTVMVNVAPVNDAPVANDDAISGDEDTVLSGNVLGNDSDVENDPLAAILVTGPAHGALTLNPDGSFSYTPEANWNGTDGFTYKANDGLLDSSAATATLTVNPANDAPVGLPSVSGTPTENQTLTADTSGVSDADGLGTFNYQWLRDGSAVSGATGNSYILGNADVGAGISVQVSYTDGQGTAENLTSATVGPVSNVNDAPSGAPVVTGTTTENQTLRVGTSSISDADGLGVFSYQWLRDGSAVSGATGNSYVLGNADVGAGISVQVSYTDGHGAVEVLTSAQSTPVVNVNDAPVGQPTINGTPVVDQALTADTTGVNDADGLGSFSYQWLRDGAVLSGATGDSYTLGAADVGSRISVEVRYTDAHGTAEGPLASAQTSAVTEAPPATEGNDLVAGVAPAASSGAIAEAPVAQAIAAATSEPAPPPAPAAANSDHADAQAERGFAMEDSLTARVAALDAVAAERAVVAAPLSAGDAQSGRQISVASTAQLTVLPDWMAAQFPQFSELGGGPTADFSPLASLSQLGAGSAQKTETLVRDLDELRETVKDGVGIEKYTLSSAVAVSTGLSVGYAAWLVRGGVLLSTLLSSMPAWRVLDPFPVLARQRDPDEDDDGDDDSLESMVGDDDGAEEPIVSDQSNGQGAPGERSDHDASGPAAGS